MTTPALSRLRERFPEARIAVLTHEKLKDLWEGDPRVNTVIGFAPGESPWSIARRLRPEHFKTALILPNSPRSALEMWLAGIPRRVGFERAWRNWLLTDRVPLRSQAVQVRKRSVQEIKRLIQSGAATVESVPASIESHQIFDYLTLTAALGATLAPVEPRLHVRREEVREVAERFGLSIGAESQPFFGLNAGAEYGPAKRWPSERFLSAAIELEKRLNCRWLIFGGKGDMETANLVTDGILRSQRERQGSGQQARPLNLAGKTSLRELCALLKLCRVLLTNDTGPMHVAAALGTPVVVPFGSTSPDLTGPGLPNSGGHRLIRSQAPCSPCFRRVCPIDFRCMTSISVDQVVAAVMEAVAPGSVD